jgi:hypothetical protein
MAALAQQLRCRAASSLGASSSSGAAQRLRRSAGVAAASSRRSRLACVQARALLKVVRGISRVLEQRLDTPPRCSCGAILPRQDPEAC